MKVFRNDVSIDEIPRVGTGTALVAARTTAGEAVLYTGPEDVVALAGFLGGVVMVNGVPYSEEGDGSLRPIEFRPGFAYVKPPAGPWFALHVDELKQKHAIVTFDATTESDEVYAKGWADAEAKANADKVAPDAVNEELLAWNDADHAVIVEDKVVAGTVVYPPGKPAPEIPAKIKKL